ncbi:MAG: NfeD family protein [Planctomycetota bacterium]
MSGEAQLYWGMVLVAVGILLIVVEAFVPSGGVIGLVSGVCAFAGVVLMWRHSTTWGVTGLSVVGVLGPASFLWAVNMLPKKPIGRNQIGAPTEEEVAARELEEIEEAEKRRSLLGATGLAVTDLKPGGEIEIDGQTLDARAEQDWIDAGSRVEVVELGSFDVVVRKA